MAGELLRATAHLARPTEFYERLNDRIREISANGVIEQMQRWPSQKPWLFGSGDMLERYDAIRAQQTQAEGDIAQESRVYGMEYALIGVFGRYAEAVYTQWQRLEPQRRAASSVRS